jgi:DNA-binding SARP family transcriptional activator
VDDVEPAGGESAFDQREVRMEFGVLGPVTARDDTGAVVDLRGPRHRAVLARLIVARRRVVPVTRLVADLWDEPPPGAVGAVQTFVAALRRALEPDRPPRSPARLLVTDGPGYALRTDAVDAWRFETAVGGVPTPDRLRQALDLWRGPAYADFPDARWARVERARLTELRLRAVEQLAQARLDAGRAADAVPDLDAHVTEHPWREDAWRLLALALYRSGRQADALAVLRRARAMLADQLGLDPGPRLRRLEADVLAQDPRLDPATVWTRAADAYDRTVAVGARARLESTVGLIRTLAVTGATGLRAAQEHRMAAIAAAAEFDDPELTARVIGAYDVPAVWTRSDDPEQARRIVAIAEHTLAALPDDHAAARCRLLATVATEMRGTRSPRGPAAAREAERLARGLRDPALLAFALNGVFMQSCTRAGLAPRRDEIGAELIAVAGRHGLVTFEVLGHLVRIQARSALGDFGSADTHAAAVDRIAERHELPLVGVFTSWYRALRLAAAGRTEQAASAYRAAGELLDGAGMPGVRDGLLPLAMLSLEPDHVDPDADWGPYRPWVEPLRLVREGDHAAAAAALRVEPPADLLYEALSCLQLRVARELGDHTAVQRLHARLLPAVDELAAGSGMVTFGPVGRHLTG